MPNVDVSRSSFKHVLLAGPSGVGKSSLAYYAPKPIGALLLDKSSIDVPPGVEAADIFYKTYPPALIDLTNDTHGRARNIADAIIVDIQRIRDHFTSKAPLTIRAGLEKNVLETWPTPATVVLEGGDFLSQHILNLVCARHQKKNPADFGNKYEAYGLRLNELHAIYDMLTYLPCNVVVTTGVHVDEEGGNVIDPCLGGAMNLEGPRKFHSSLYVYSKDGKHYVRTRSNAKFRGFKLGGRFGAPEEIEITVPLKTKAGESTNPWQLLFG